MKIAIIYESTYPDRLGGVEKRNYEIAKRLSLQHDITFVCEKFWSGQENEKKINNINYLAISEGSNLYNKEGRRKFIKSITFSLKLFKLLSKEYDLIDCASIPPNNILICWLLTKIKKIPMVVTWIEYWNLKMWIEYAGKIPGIIAYFIQSTAILASKNIIAISSFTAKNIKKKSTIILNGVDFQIIDKTLAKQKDIDLIFCGRLIDHKNPLFFLDVVKAITTSKPQLKVLMIGTGPLKKAIIQKIKEASLHRNVTLTSNLSEKDYFSYLSRSKILFLPSEREGFGIVGIEAMACGTFFATIDAPENAAKSLIDSELHGCIFKKDTCTAANKLVDVLRHPQLFTHNVMSNRKNYAKRFDWNVIAEETITAYQKAAT